ncbi:MAG: DNA polymerase IV [Campylobacterales bacterium]
MIIHLDLDCFFVSAERTRSSCLKDKPVVVVKSSDQAIFLPSSQSHVLTQSVGMFSSLVQAKRTWRGFDPEAWKQEFIDDQGNIHGVCVAKSYEAKRYGIQTGTPLAEALRLCPHLLIVPEDHLFYQILSHRLREFLQTKIPVLEQYSIDEFWGDLSGWVKDEETEKFMRSLQAEILERFDLPVSIGASSSKWIAKLATELNKPFGITLIPKDRIKQTIAPLPIEDFPGIGRSLSARLRRYGIQTLGELLEAKSLLYGWGHIGRELYARVEGSDNEPVVAYHDRRSIGISRSFPLTHDRVTLRRYLMILARHLAHMISMLHLQPTTYWVKFRYEQGLSSSTSTTINRLFSEVLLRTLATTLMKQIDIYPEHGIYHISLSASNFITRAKPKTYELIEFDQDQQRHHLTEKITKLREKYGMNIIMSGAETILA